MINLLPFQDITISNLTLQLKIQWLMHTFISFSQQFPWGLGTDSILIIFHRLMRLNLDLAICDEMSSLMKVFINIFWLHGRKAPSVSCLSFLLSNIFSFIMVSSPCWLSMTNQNLQTITIAPLTIVSESPLQSTALNFL